MAKDWIKKAVNPKHKGYCTPMTKSTCTPRRKAFAKTMKKHHGFHKMEDGGVVAKKTYVPKAIGGMMITPDRIAGVTGKAKTTVPGNGAGEIDYSGIFSMMAPFLQGQQDTQIQPGQQQVQEGASTGSMIGGGAAKGAAMGSQFGPWGTAIGAVVGAGTGLLGASKERKRERKELNQIEAVNRDKYQNLDIDPNFDPYGEQSTFYMEDGGMVHNMGGPQEEQQQQPEQMKIVDIEKGELLVNPLTFDILREYTNPNKYSPHASNPQKEPIGNFTAISPGHMVIPKKLATKYKAGDTLSKKSIIMQIIKNQRNEPQEVIESPMGEVEEYGKGGVGCGGGGSRMRDYAYGGYVEDAETIPVEVEGGEVYETPGGTVKKVKGPSHEKGGVAKVLPAGTKIYSDRLGINGNTMAERKLKRENVIDSITAGLRKPTNDTVSPNARLALNNKFMEEQKDMFIQDDAQFINWAQQQYKMDQGKKPLATTAGGGGGGLAQIVNAYGTGPDGLQLPGDDNPYLWGTPPLKPKMASPSYRTTGFKEPQTVEDYNNNMFADRFAPAFKSPAVDPAFDLNMFAAEDAKNTANTNNYMNDNTPPPPGRNKFGISGVDVSRALNFVPTAFGAGIAARYEPEIYDENNQLGRAKNLISDIETNPSIEASRNAIRTAGANRNKLLNNLNTPSTRAEAASTYGDVLDAEGNLIQNATNTAMDARNKKRGALAEMEAKQGDARLNAREKLRVNMQMNRANSNKMIQSAFSELSQNYGAQVRDDAELNSINQILDYAKINKSGSLEDTKAFGAAVMELMNSGKGVTVENLQDAYATSGMGYSKGRSTSRNSSNRNVRSAVSGALTSKKKR